MPNDPRVEELRRQAELADQEGSEIIDKGLAATKKIREELEQLDPDSEV